MEFQTECSHQDVLTQVNDDKLSFLKLFNIDIGIISVKVPMHTKNNSSENFISEK